jgi:hypothetical protein
VPRAGAVRPGELVDRELRVTVESDQLVVFGDGIEADNLLLG